MDELLGDSASKKRKFKHLFCTDNMIPASLLDFKPSLINQVLSNVVDPFEKVLETDSISTSGWDSIYGMQTVKTCLDEWLLWPLVNPSLFHNIVPVKTSLLLYGPFGCGKSSIAKAISMDDNIIFFHICPTSMISRSFVRVLFQLAKEMKPSIIFLDKLEQVIIRKEIRQQLIIEMENNICGRVGLLAATSKPTNLDMAVVANFSKGIFVQPPDVGARAAIISERMLTLGKACLSEEELQQISLNTHNFTGADIEKAIYECQLRSVRSIMGNRTILEVQPYEVPSFGAVELMSVLCTMKPSVTPEKLIEYMMWQTTS